MKDSTRKMLAARIPTLIRNNFSRKIIAALIAIVVLIAVKNQDQPQESIIRNVKVRFELPQNVRFQTHGEPEVFVRLTVKGKSSVLNRLAPDRFSLPVKITAADVRNGRVSLNPEDVIFNKSIFYDDIEIINVQPAVYNLKLDTIVERKIPVHITHSKKDLPSGYMLEEIRVPGDQEYVTVKGPERIVRNISKIDTDTVPLNQITQDFNMTVPLICPDPDVTLSFDKVVVLGKIADHVLREISDVPVRLLLSPPFNLTNVNEYELQPEKVRIRYLEPRRRDNMKNAVKASFHVMVDISGLHSGAKECQVLYRCVRPDVKIIEVHPATITVTVKSNQFAAKSNNTETSAE
ncbi:MAG: YbbR-like domain-containing protein [Lentisphaeria bacterium]|nr:YbbR-like domain-containing protein [Lentisphaeria bacterium]